MSEAGAHVVHEVTGSDLAPKPAAAVIAMGVVALLIIGVAPALLGALVDEHRITPSGLGLTAMLELLTMGVSTALAGALLKGDALRPIGAGAVLLLAAANVGTQHAMGMGVLIARMAAGVPEGVLLWITVGMIARSQTPERWAGVFFTAQVIAQLAMALLFAFIVLPRFGADGGYAAMALACLIGLPAAMMLPTRYGPLIHSAGMSGAPPLRGLIALLATVLFVSGNGAVSVYLQPLAHQAGLSSDVARTALWASLAAQILGGVVATSLAGRVRYFHIFGVVVVGFLAVWTVFGLSGSPAWLFIGATMVSGAIALLVGPFLVPMTIEADPSRRAAMQSAGAQLLGGAGGPLLAAIVVGERDIHGVLWLGGSLLLIGFAVIAWLHFSARHTDVETAS